MTTVRKTIVVTSKQDAWIKAQIAKGGYTNDSELIRDLIRKAQSNEAEAGLSDERKAQILANMKKHEATLQKLAQ